MSEISNCCGAPIVYTDLCSDCLEHADVVRVVPFSETKCAEQDHAFAASSDEEFATGDGLICLRCHERFELDEDLTWRKV